MSRNGRISADSSPRKKVPQTPHGEVVRLARTQHGLITLEQLRQVGLTRAQIRSRTQRGEWTPAATKVFRIGGAPVTRESQVTAHVLAAGPAAMASHRTAAVLWGLEDYAKAVPELSVPRSRRYQGDGVGVHRSGDLHLVSATIRAGLPVTPPARTLLDLAGVVTPSKLHLTIEAARRQRLATWDGLLSCLVAHARRGRPGVAALCSLLDQHQGEIAATESGFERLVATTLLQAGLPAPVLQHQVHIEGRTYRIDLAYPDARVAIELDGSQHRDSPIWEADHIRQNHLVLAGWTVLRFTWRNYRRGRARLVREVRSAITAGNRTLASRPGCRISSYYSMS